MYRFFRLIRKNTPCGKGRQYFKLVCYPQDMRSFATQAEAEAHATRFKYSAILCPGHAWVALNDFAAQCVKWHNAGRNGYVTIY